MTVVHYLNQFFAGLGGEEAVDHEPVRLDGPQGPGKALEAAGLHVDTTVACGDDRFALNEGDCLATLLGWIEEADPDVVVCGPSFGSGRYGYACGVLARELGRRGTPVVAAMTPDSPGVLANEGAAYIVPTTANVAGMRDAVPLIASLASRLAAGAPVGTAEEEGYLPRGLRVNVRSERLGAERAVDLVLAKLAGDVRTEIAPPTDRVSPPDPLADPAAALVALVTEAGCVRRGTRTGCRRDTRTSGFATRSPIALSSHPRTSFRCTPASTRPRRTATPTVSCRSTRRARSSRRDGSAGSTTSSSRRRASTPQWRCRRGWARRSAWSSATRASTP